MLCSKLPSFLVNVSKIPKCIAWEHKKMFEKAVNVNRKTERLMFVAVSPNCLRRVKPA